MAWKLVPEGPVGIACLGITHPHASGRVKVLKRQDDMRLLGAWDDSRFLEPFARAMELEIRGKNEILSDPKVHAVLVHSKSDEMVDLSVEALEAGKAVLVEKPAGRHVADLKRLTEAVKATGGLLQVGYSYRYASAVSAMHVALETGKLGKVMQVRGHAACSLDEALAAHLNQPEDMGGALFVIGCHLLDLLIHHFGMPTSVNARVPKFAQFTDDRSREDAAGALLTYPDKLITVDFFSWDPLPWIESWGISAYGTEGVMHARPLPSTFQIYQRGNLGSPKGWTEWRDTSFPVEWAAEKTEYTPELAEIGNAEYFTKEAQAFVNSLRTGAPSTIPASHALDIARLIEAFYASSALSGAEVSL
jgi:predicted dehydrogenase